MHVLSFTGIILWLVIYLAIDIALLKYSKYYVPIWIIPDLVSKKLVWAIILGVATQIVLICVIAFLVRSI